MGSAGPRTLITTINSPSFSKQTASFTNHRSSCETHQLLPHLGALHQCYLSSWNCADLCLDCVCVWVCLIEKRLTGSRDIQTDNPCVYIYNSAFIRRPMKCHWKSGNKPLKLTQKNHHNMFCGRECWGSTTDMSFSSWLVEGEGVAGVVIPDMASAYISLSPGCVLRLCRADSLLTVSLEPAGVSEEPFTTPTTLRQLCNPSWGCGMSL